jgi:hypothetical protein
MKLCDGHKELSDRVTELTLELKSVKDDYDTLRRSLGIKIECLEKRVEKGNH